MLSQLTVPYYLIFISAITTIINEIFSLLLRLFRLQRHEYCGLQTSTLINNLSQGFSTSIHNKQACGIVIGRWYIGYVSYTYATYQGSIHVNITILCSSKCWEKLLTDNSKLDTIVVYKHNYYINVKYRRLVPWSSQQYILDKIIEQYKKEKRLSVYIYGSPGQGKSQIAMFLAQYFNSTLSSELDIFEEHDPRFGKQYSIIALINSLTPTEDKPLILMINEIDKILTDKIKNTSQGKQQWNELLDEYDNGFYNNTILIFTSNVPKSEIDKIDPSLLRPGRIHLTFEMEKDNVIEIH